MAPTTFDERSLHTVLAALRFYQTVFQPDYRASVPESSETHPIWKIATNNGEVRPLSSKEIDELCEEINLGGPSKES